MQNNCKYACYLVCINFETMILYFCDHLKTNYVADNETKLPKKRPSKDRAIFN